MLCDVLEPNHVPGLLPIPRGLASAALSLEDKLPLRVWCFEGFVGRAGSVASLLGWQQGGAGVGTRQNQGGQRTQLGPQARKDACAMSGGVGVKSMCSGARQPGPANEPCDLGCPTRPLGVSFLVCKMGR